MQRHLREGNYASRIGTGAAVYMAGVLEYISAEILEISGENAALNKKARINPRHIMTAIKSDAEMSELLKNVTIPYAGVMPYIHASLLPKSSKKNKPEEVENGEVMEAGTEQLEKNEETESDVEEDDEDEEKEANDEVESNDDEELNEDSREFEF